MFDMSSGHHAHLRADLVVSNPQYMHSVAVSMQWSIHRGNKK